MSNTNFTFLDYPFQNANSAPSYSFMRNKLINGGFGIDQRAGGGTTSVATSGYYSADRWFTSCSQANKFSVTQYNNGVNPYLAGVTSVGQLNLVSLSAYTSVPGDFFTLQQRIEANNIPDWAFGLSTARPLTLSFYVTATTAGTYGGSLLNAAQTTSFPFSYVVTSPNTWTYVTIPIPACTIGTWVLNGAVGGAILQFSLGCGSTYQTATTGWQTGTYYAPAGCTQVVGTNGLNLAFAAVQLETGSIATPFEQRSYGTELALCQRYCYAPNSLAPASASIAYANGYAVSATAASAAVFFPATMRTSPSLTLIGAATLFGFNIPAGTAVVTAISAPLVSLNSAFLVITSTGLTTGQGGILVSNASNATGLIFSAEL